MAYFDIFPKFGALDIVLPKGFIDDSSSKYPMPTFVMQLGNGNILRLWVDFIDKSFSKFPNEPRFCLAVYDANHKRLHDDIRNDSWLETQIIIRGLQELHTVHASNRPD